MIRFLCALLVCATLAAGDAKLPAAGTWTVSGAPSLSGAVYVTDPSGARFPAYYYAKDNHQLTGSITVGASLGGGLSFSCAHVVHGHEAPTPRVLPITGKPAPVLTAAVRLSGPWTAPGKDGGTCAAEVDLGFGETKAVKLPATAKLSLRGPRGGSGTWMTIETTLTVPGRQIGAADDQPLRVVIIGWARPGQTGANASSLSCPGLPRVLRL